MNNKVVLVVDEDSHHAEKLVFFVRLGGYETRIFSSEAPALNWAKYGCAEEETLCLLCNNLENFDRAEQIAAAWIAAAVTLPVVLVQRGKGSWNRRLSIAESDHFFVCEPESVMQTLEILTAIAASNRLGAGSCTEKRTILMGGGSQCK